MKALPLANCNLKMAPPPDWDEATQGPCGTLDIHFDGESMRSAWLPSPEELAALNAGQPVILGIIGRSHPVVFLTVNRPGQ